jgi:hypothetical protein
MQTKLKKKKKTLPIPHARTQIKNKKNKQTRTGNISLRSFKQTAGDPNRLWQINHHRESLSLSLSLSLVGFIYLILL